MARLSLPSGSGVALAFCLLFAAAPARAADRMLELAVTLNGHDTGQVGEFVERNGALFVHPDDLKSLGVQVPAAVVPAADGLIPLSAVRDLSWRLDTASQTLALSAPDALLVPTMLAAQPQSAGPVTVESGTGATLNYDVVGNVTDGALTASGLFDGRMFSPMGVLSTGLLAYGGNNGFQPGGNGLVRLDSAFSRSDPGTLRRYTAGDFITGGLSWTRPVRMGGLQLRSDFSLRPDLVTFPLPSVSGTAAVPSTIDVLVNNTQALSRQISPGPFQVSQLPVVTGAGAVTTTITNALGQQVAATLPFYASSDLLAPGLDSYSAEAGWVRDNWGLVSNDYRNMAASGTWRRGLSDILTGELHAEGTGGQAMAGLGAVFNVFNLGIADAAVAGSVAGSHTGWQVSLGAQRQARVFSFGVSALFTSAGFRDLAAMNGEPAPRRQISANLGLSLGRFGSLGLAYTGVSRDSAPGVTGISGTGGFIAGGFGGQNGGVVAPGDILIAPAQRADILSASYTVQVGSFSLYANGFHDVSQHGNSGLVIGLTLPLGERSSASVSAGTGSAGTYGQFQAQQSPVLIGDWGYQAYAVTDPGHEFAEGQYKSPWALVGAGVDRLGSQTTLRADARGAVSVVDGGVFASNAIDDSFAIVDTEGQADVTVLSENRPVGRTDSAGRILVPDLRSFEANHIAIDPNDVPVSDTIPAAAKEVRPQDRSGVVVKFPIRRNYAALVKLADAAGKPLPVGSVVTLSATGATAPMGYDGQTYVENLKAGDNGLEVLMPDGTRCRAHFQYAFKAGTMASVGPLTCAVLP